eukprot:1145928-Pyramimonas_sp.AAC.1
MSSLARAIIGISRLVGMQSINFIIAGRGRGGSSGLRQAVKDQRSRGLPLLFQLSVGLGQSK